MHTNKKVKVTDAAPQRERVVIIGALGMDFHTFNTCFRDKEQYDVLAFTVAVEQNVGTLEQKERRYPKELAGGLYPQGIPMIPESQLESFVKANAVDTVVFAYSDVSHAEVMHKASRALNAGANYKLMSLHNTMLKSSKPVISVCSVRTGCGKSQVSRVVCRQLKAAGLKVVAVREPMPYGDLVQQKCMRFAEYSDMEKYSCTVEEREEYEPYIEQGLVIYSGVDYEAILRQAEAEADVVVWDGGNNEVSFFQPNCLLVVADPLRPGHELNYHPGEVNARAADVFIINKVNSVKDKADIDVVLKNLKAVNPSARTVMTNSEVTCEKPDAIKGKRVIIVEDGPTVTHGGMAFGAGVVAAHKFGAKQIVDPRPSLRGGMKGVFQEFPHLEQIIPAMGYSKEQLADLEATLNTADCDVIVNGSPMHLAKLVNCNKPIVRVAYDVVDISGQDANALTLQAVIAQFADKECKKAQ